MIVKQMTAADSHQADASDGENSFAQSVEELYEAIACEEDGVISESASALIAAVTYLELEVTEAQMTEAMRKITPAKENLTYVCCITRSLSAPFDGHTSPHSHIYTCMHVHVCCITHCTPCVHGYSSVHVLEDNLCQHAASAQDYAL